MRRSILYSRRIVQKRTRIELFLGALRALNLISLHSFGTALDKIGRV